MLEVYSKLNILEVNIIDTSAMSSGVQKQPFADAVQNRCS